MRRAWQLLVHLYDSAWSAGQAWRAIRALSTDAAMADQAWIDLGDFIKSMHEQRLSMSRYTWAATAVIQIRNGLAGCRVEPSRMCAKPPTRLAEKALQLAIDSAEPDPDPQFEVHRRIHLLQTAQQLGLQMPWLCEFESQQ